MSTLADVKAAEKRMNDARAALAKYTERLNAAKSDSKVHLRLAEAVRKAADEYVKVVADLR
jgi:hypothetical protein